MRSLSFYVLFLCFLTVIPGFLNKASARVLRWPILLTTYFQIAVELSLYAILRMFIKFMEFLFQSGTHRRMRREIWESEDYEEVRMRSGWSEATAAYRPQLIISRSSFPSSPPLLSSPPLAPHRRSG